MSERISIAELRRWTEHLPPFNLGDSLVPFRADHVLALVEAVEAAHTFLDLDFGYLPAPTQQALVPLLDALARFDFGATT